MREPADTYRRRLYERAINQHGFVTTKDAEEADVPAVELRKIANRAASSMSPTAFTGSPKSRAMAVISSWRRSFELAPART